MAFATTTHISQAPFGTAFFARFTAAFSRMIRSAQTGRMIGVLASMSDDQLHHIGITRGEIADYAEMLMLPRAAK